MHEINNVDNNCNVELVVDGQARQANDDVIHEEPVKISFFVNKFQHAEEPEETICEEPSEETIIYDEEPEETIANSNLILMMRITFLRQLLLQ